MKPILYLDMDGVLADFERKATEIFGAGWSDEVEKPNWGKLAEYPHWYRELPPMVDALELYDGCCKFMGDKNQVQILTALPNRAKFARAAEDKIWWAKHHISPNIRVHFGPHAQDKQYHKQHPDDILIDDKLLNIEQWIEKGGFGIHHIDAESSLYKLFSLKNYEYL